ncbi:MAG: type II toxin-antitoxin system PemK/MazF family toxin [Ilumatobacteraceae bacterium]
MTSSPTWGEVWWYEPPSLPRRPFLVVTRPVACELLNQLLAVPATRTIRGIPTEVRLDRADGMPTECVLTLDNVTLVRPVFLTARVTTLGADVMRRVCRALADATVCAAADS